MRHVAYLKKDLAYKRGRVVSVRENTSDSDSETSVVKNFIYLVTRVDAVPDVLPDPEIRIIKKIDTKGRSEGFLFKVKHVIFVKKNRFISQIRYCHSLDIKIMWKTHVLAPDKPAALA